MKRRSMFLGNAVLMSVVSIVMRGIAVSFNAYIHRKTGAEAMGLFTLVINALPMLLPASALVNALGMDNMGIGSMLTFAGILAVMKKPE